MKLIELRARRARLEAEREEANTITFPADLRALDSEAARDQIEGQRVLFEHIVDIEGQPAPDIPDNDKTIGEFYEAVRLAAYALNPDFELSSQITGPLVPIVVTSLMDLDAAVGLVLTQGEGATGTPFETGPDDLAHYYRFREVQLERRLVWDPDAEALKLGDVFARPDIYAAKSPPASGYDGSIPQEIRSLSDAFNKRYSEMLVALEQIWGAGAHSALLRSMELMFQLRPIAQQMMRYDDGTGLGFIPEFRFQEHLSLIRTDDALMVFEDRK